MASKPDEGITGMVSDTDIEEMKPTNFFGKNRLKA
jgi:hypothetical protein